MAGEGGEEMKELSLAGGERRVRLITRVSSKELEEVMEVNPLYYVDRVSNPYDAEFRKMCRKARLQGIERSKVMQ